MVKYFCSFHCFPLEAAQSLQQLCYLFPRLDTQMISLVESFTLIHHADDCWDLCLAFPKCSHQQGWAVPPLSPNLRFPVVICLVSVPHHWLCMINLQWLRCSVEPNKLAETPGRSFVCSKTSGDPAQDHCIPKTDTLQACLSTRMIYALLLPYCFFNIQLFFQMPSSYDDSPWIEEMWNHYKIPGVQISWKFLINSLVRSCIPTFQCKPHAFFIKKTQLGNVWMSQKKVCKESSALDVRLETFPAIGADNNSFIAEG